MALGVYRNTGVCKDLNSFTPTVRGDVRRVRQVSPQPGGGRDLLGPDRPVGQPEQQAHPRAENPAVRSSAHGRRVPAPPLSRRSAACLRVFITAPPSPSLLHAAPRLLRERGGNTERQQPDQHLHRREDVLLEPGHAFSAAGSVPPGREAASLESM